MDENKGIDKKQMKILAAELAMVFAYQQQYSIGLTDNKEKEKLLEEAMPRFMEGLNVIPEHGGYQNHWREMTARAGGKLAYYQSLQAASKSWYKENPFWLRSILVPVFLLLITALLGNWVATSLQESSFKRQQVFQHKLTLLKESRDEAAQLTAELKEVFLKVAEEGMAHQKKINKAVVDGETQMENYLRGERDWGQRKLLPRLGELRQRVDKLFTKRRNQKGVEGEVILPLIEKSYNKIGTFISCLESDMFKDCTGYVSLMGTKDKKAYHNAYFGFFGEFENMVSAYTEAIQNAFEEK